MKCIRLLLIYLFSIFPLSAQEETEEGELIVIAELNRTEVRQFIEEAEDQFYAIFNDNNDDEDFTITCSRQTPTGSNIPVRVCEPEFLHRARADNQNTFQFNRGATLTESAIQSALQPQYDQLQEKMEQMTREIPQFAQISSILAQLRARLAELTR